MKIKILKFNQIYLKIRKSLKKNQKLIKQMKKKKNLRIFCSLEFNKQTIKIVMTVNKKKNKLVKVKKKKLIY